MKNPTPDDLRAVVEEGAAKRLKLTPCPGSLPEHFGFYSERVHDGAYMVGRVFMASDSVFREAAKVFAMYYVRFTTDCDDVRLINRVCADVMAKGADRPTAWEVALNYHANIRAKVGPNFNLDDYKVVVMTESEATPEVVAALMEQHNNDNSGKLH